MRTYGLAEDAESVRLIPDRHRTWRPCVDLVMLITHREINLAIIPELLRRRTMLSENNRGSRLRCYTVDDQQAIRQLIENWVLWRDTGEWERLATLWHPEGRMITTWNQSGAAEFISRSRRAWENGIQVLHAMGGASVEIRGKRAVAQSRMEITQRALVDGVLVDVTCRGRFWDALEKRGEKWGLMLRQPIYELDRMTPVDPAATLVLDATLLAAFPEGYRHLAYLQTRIGFDVKKSMPSTRGSEVEALMARGVRWLEGEAAACLE